MSTWISANEELPVHGQSVEWVESDGIRRKGHYDHIIGFDLNNHAVVNWSLWCPIRLTDKAAPAFLFKQAKIYNYMIEKAERAINAQRNGIIPVKEMWKQIHARKRMKNFILECIERVAFDERDFE